SAFFFSGDGYYDDSPGVASFASRRLPNFEVDSDSLYPAAYYATDESGVPVRQPDGRFLVTGSDMTQRLWVKDRHYGWIPRARVSLRDREGSLQRLRFPSQLLVPQSTGRAHLEREPRVERLRELRPHRDGADPGRDLSS